MIERKIIITHCKDCPFAEYKNPFYGQPHMACKKINRILRMHEQDIHPECPLKVNIPSKNFFENV